MIGSEEGEPDGAREYAHAPRPIGRPLHLRVSGETLTVDAGRALQHLHLSNAQEVRLSYSAGRFGGAIFVTRLRLHDGRTVSFNSVTWPSMVEMRTQGPEYRTFVAALLRATARANPETRFIAGVSRLRWGLTAAAAAGLLVGLAYVALRTFRAGAPGAAAIAAAVAGLGIWQLEPLVRLNRPRTFAPDDPPPELLPRR